MTRRVHKTILRVEKSRDSLEHIQGEKYAAVASLPDTSLLRKSSSFISAGIALASTTYLVRPSYFRCLKARFKKTPSCLTLIFLINLKIADEPNAVETNAMTRSTSSISVRTTAGHAAAEHIPVRSKPTEPLAPGLLA
ncbi:hypothetical protein MRX96_057871 [Rhipicephalus microplus]